MSGLRGLTWKAYVSCVSSFPLQGVHRFESPRLSDMSNRLSCSHQHIVITGMMAHGDLLELLYYNHVLQLLNGLV
jgi:hypothetical protein